MKKAIVLSLVALTVIFFSGCGVRTINNPKCKENQKKVKKLRKENPHMKM